MSRLHKKILCLFRLFLPYELYLRVTKHEWYGEIILLFQKFQLINANKIRVKKKLIYAFMAMAMADNTWTHWPILTSLNRGQSSLLFLVLKEVLIIVKTIPISKRRKRKCIWSKTNLSDVDLKLIRYYLSIIPRLKKLSQLNNLWYQFLKYLRAPDIPHNFLRSLRHSPFKMLSSSNGNKLKNIIFTLLFFCLTVSQIPYSNKIIVY